MPRKGNVPPTPCPSEQAYRRHLAHGEEPCDGCRQAHRDHQFGLRPRSTRFLQPECGTRAGYFWHRKHSEPTCQDCRDAVAALQRERYGKTTGTTPGRALAPCGTPAAYRRHLMHGEEPCDQCRTAKSAYNRVDHQTRKVLEAMAREEA